MNLPFLLVFIVFTRRFCTPVHSFLKGKGVQDHMDNFIDVEKFRQHGIKSLDEETRDHIWSFFKSFHRRVYSSHDEEQKRRAIFHNNIDFVVQHKLKTFRTFEIELNHLADLTADEFKNYKKGFIPSKNSHKRRFESYKGEEDVDEFLRRLTKLDERHHQRHGKNSGGKRGNSNLPSSFDWRDQNAVGSIKDQGNCGACYAFATSAVMESLYAIQNNAQSVVGLSPQQIVDCEGNGCNGDSFPPTVDYLNQQGRQRWIHILTLASNNHVQRTVCIPSGDETSLSADVVSYGPIFVGVGVEIRM